MSIYDTHKPVASEGSGVYLKIKDGETVKLRIASAPAIFEAQGERDGKPTLTTRYGWLVFNQDSKSAQILQQSATFFKSIAALAQDEEWGDPQDYDIKVSRQGSSFNDTTYTVMPSANRGPLGSEAQELIKAVDLLEMLKKSPFSQHVMWLAEFDEMAATANSADFSQDVNDLAAAGEAKKQAGLPKSGLDKARAKADEIKSGKKPEPENVAIEDIGAGPMNLDDIPF